MAFAVYARCGVMSSFSYTRMARHCSPPGILTHASTTAMAMATEAADMSKALCIMIVMRTAYGLT